MTPRRNGVAGVRSMLYATARALGDVQAASRGPSAYGRRLIRKRAYGQWNGLLRRMLRGLGV